MAAKALNKTVLDINGSPEAGAKLESFVKGTSTPLALYTDSGLTTPATNPVIADAAGRFDVYADNALNYSLNVKTSADVDMDIQFDYTAGGDSFIIIRDGSWDAHVAADSVAAWDENGARTSFDRSAGRAWLGLTDGEQPEFTTDFANITNTPTTLSGYGITDAQPLEATLTGIAALSPTADQLIYASGADTFSTATLTSFARTLLDDTTQGAMQTTLGLVPGTNVQAYSAFLDEVNQELGTGDQVEFIRVTTANNEGLWVEDTVGTPHRFSYIGGDNDSRLVSITSQDIILAPAGTDTFRFASDGSFRNGSLTDVTSGSSDGFYFSGGQLDISRNVAPAIRARRRTSNGHVAQWYRDTTLVGAVSVTTTNTSYLTSSDYRLKNDIQDLSAEEATEFIGALRPRKYVWNTTQEPARGFIAHEFQEVNPKAVSGVKDGPEMQGMDASDPETIASIIRELQTLRAEVNDLKGGQS